MTQLGADGKVIIEPTPAQIKAKAEAEAKKLAEAKVEAEPAK